MTNEQLRELVVRELAAIAPEADLANLDPAADMRAEFDLDSMDVLRFATALHEKLGVDIPEAGYAQIVSLGSCLAYLQQRTRS